MVRRRLTLSAWQPVNARRGFDRVAAAQAVKALPKADAVLATDEGMTYVETIKVGKNGAPTIFQVLSLHDEANRPNAWSHGRPAQTIRLPSGTYTAFATHVVLWDDNVAGHDMWANAPGLGRLAMYIHEHTDQRVMFRPLYDRTLKSQLDDLKGWRGIEIGIHDPHKAALARRRGLLRGLMPEKVRSLNLKLGMGRGPGSSYLPDDVEDEIVGVIGRAEEFFDSLIIKGHSKTQKTPAGNPKLLKINVLTHRLQEERRLAADTDATNQPDRREVVNALKAVRNRMRADGRLREALEIRAKLDGS